MKSMTRILIVVTIVLATASTTTAFFGRYRTVVRESYREGPLLPRMGLRASAGCQGTVSYSTGILRSRVRERSVISERGAGCYGSSRSFVYPPSPLTVPAPPPQKDKAPAPKEKVSASDGQPVVVLNDALDEVNAKRAARGMRPFLRDPLLTLAARNTAVYRARYRLFGHTSNDFAFLPQGATADAAGCAAYTPDYGWMSCAVYDDYQYAGASYEIGADGRRYMHLFVRGGSGVMLPGSPQTVVPSPVASQVYPQFGQIGYDPNCPNGVCNTPQSVPQYTQQRSGWRPGRILFGR